MALVSFDDWWRMAENQQDFWRISYKGVPVSLGEGPRSIFCQILQKLKLFHEQGVGYGNLLQGVFIGDNKQIILASNGFNPNNQEPLVLIRQDLLDFKTWVTWVENRISKVQAVGWSDSFNKFYELYKLLPSYSYGIDGLRRFGFFVRNNPLFMNVTGKFLFYRKVLTFRQSYAATFQANVRLPELQNWSQNVTNPHLVAVRDYKRNMTDINPTNQHTYATPDGSVVFFGNCERHVRLNNAGVTYYDDARILLALEDDLPMAIPTWFFALVRDLDLNQRFDLQGFLSEEPSVFT